MTMVHKLHSRTSLLEADYNLDDDVLQLLLINSIKIVYQFFILLRQKYFFVDMMFLI